MKSAVMTLLCLQIPVVRQLWLQGVVVALDDRHQTEVRPEGLFFVGDTISLAPERVYGKANRYILTMSGMPDVVQDSPSFSVTFERVSERNYSKSHRKISCSTYCQVPRMYMAHFIIFKSRFLILNTKIHSFFATRQKIHSLFYTRHKSSLNFHFLS